MTTAGFWGSPMVPVIGKNFVKKTTFGGLTTASGLYGARVRNLGLLVSGAAGLCLCASLVSAAPKTMTRVSVDSAGAEGNAESIQQPALSSDGRYVAFWSVSSNLVTADTNDASDVFVHDRVTGVTTRVSVDSAGVQANNWSYDPAISADGRYVAFQSLASNLVAADPGPLGDVFIHDRATGATTRLAIESIQGKTYEYAANPSFATGGRYVVFQAGIVIPGSHSANGPNDVLVFDQETGTTTRVSVNTTGEAANDDSKQPVISADGRYVAFESLASDLISDDTNGLYDVFVYDRVAASTTRVNVSSTGAQATDAGPYDWSGQALISADGRFVAFTSYADNLVPGDTNFQPDVFVKDVQTGAITRVNVDSAGCQTTPYYFNSSSGNALSSDGRYVAFASNSSNLATSDTNGTSDLFIHDRASGTTTRISVDVAGGQANGASYSSVMTPDGRYVAFSSEASNLVDGDMNGQSDIFVLERGPATGLAACHVPALTGIPDSNTDATPDLAIMRGYPAVGEIRDGAAGTLLGAPKYLDYSFSSAATAILPDTDGDDVGEFALLAVRDSDNRMVVQIRDYFGIPTPRTVWFGTDRSPIALATIANDAHNDGVPQLAVLSVDDTDGHGVVEVRNVNGVVNSKTIGLPVGYAPRDIAIVPDADGNDVPDFAVLSTRESDGRTLVQIRNADASGTPYSAWFARGHVGIDLAPVNDKEADGIPEVAVLSARESDGRLLVELKNASSAAQNLRRLWLSPGYRGIAMGALGAAAGSSVPQIAVLMRRNSDSRVVVSIINADGTGAPRSLLYSVGFTPRDLSILPDLDGNGIEEVGVLLMRDSDGRFLVQTRNASGPAAPRNYWLTQ
jgi:hypothetical protein